LKLYNIANWILANTKIVFLLHLEDVKDSIQNLLKIHKEKNPVCKYRPGVMWCNLFLNKYKDIAKRHTEVSLKVRATVTEHSIR